MTDRELQILLKAKNDASNTIREVIKDINSLKESLGSLKTVKFDFKIEAGNQFKALIDQQRNASKEMIADAQNEAKERVALSKAATDVLIAQTRAATQIAIQGDKSTLEAAKTASGERIAVLRTEMQERIAIAKGEVTAGVSAEKAASSERMNAINAAVTYAMEQERTLASLETANARVRVATEQGASKERIAIEEGAVRERIAAMQAEFDAFRTERQAEVREAAMAAKERVSAETNSTREYVTELQTAARAESDFQKALTAATAQESRERVATIQAEAKTEAASLLAVAKESATVARSMSAEGAASAKIGAAEIAAAAKIEATELNNEARAAEAAAKANAELGASSNLAGHGMMMAAQNFFFAGLALKQGVTDPIVKGIKDIIMAGSNFEDAFAGVKKAVTGDDSVFAKLNQDIRNLAKILPASREDIAKVAEEAGYLGITADNILKVSEAAIRMGQSTDISTADALDIFGRLAAVFDVSQNMIPLMMSDVAELGVTSAATESDIAKMSFRIAGAASVIGLTIPQTFALADALASMGVKAEMGGSTISKVLETIAKAVEAGGADLQAFADASNMSAGQFATAWKTDPLNAFMSFLNGLKDVKNAGGPVFGLLNDINLDGIRATDVLLRMANNTGLVASAQDVANKEWASGNALTDISNKRYATLSAQVVLLKNRFSDLAITIYDHLRPSLILILSYANKMVEALKPLVDWFTTLSSKALLLGTIVLLLTTVLGPLFIIIAGIAQILVPAVLTIFAIAAAFNSLVVAIAALLIYIEPLRKAVVNGLVWAFILLRDTFKSFMLAFHGDWIDNEGIRRLHRYAGELGDLARGFKDAIRDIFNFGTISSGTLLVFHGRMRTVMTVAKLLIDSLHSAFDALAKSQALGEVWRSLQRLAHVWDAQGFIAALRTIPSELSRIGDAILRDLGAKNWTDLGSMVLAGLINLSGDAATAIFNWIKSEVGKVKWDEVAAAIGKGIVTAWSLDENLSDKLSSWVSAQSDKVQWGDIAAIIQHGIVTGWDETIDLATRFKNWLGSQLKNIKWGSTLAGVGGSIIGSILGGMLLGGPGALIGGLIGKILGKSIESALKNAKGIDFGAIASAIGTGIKKAWDATVDLATPILSWVANQMSGIKWSDVAKSIGNGIKDGWDTTVDLASKVLAWVKSQVDVISADDAKKVATAIGQKIADSWDATVDLATNLLSWVKGQITGISAEDAKKVAASVGGKIAANWDNTVDIATPILGWLDTALKNVKEKDWKAIAKRIATGLENAAKVSGDLYDAGKAIAGRIDQGISDFDFSKSLGKIGASLDLGLSGTSLNGISGTFQPVLDFLGQLLNIVKDPAMGTLESIGNSLSILGGGIRDFISGFTKNVDTGQMKQLKEAWLPVLEKLSKISLYILAGSVWLLAHAVEALAKQAVPMATFVALLLRLAGPALAHVFNGLVLALTGLGKIVDGVITFFTGLKDIFTGNWQKGLGEVGNGLKKIFDGAKNFDAGVFGPFWDFLKWIFNVSDNAGFAVEQFMEKVGKFAVLVIPDGLDKLLGFFKDVFNLKDVKWPDLGELPTIVGDTFSASVALAVGAYKDISKLASKIGWPDLGALPGVLSDAFVLATDTVIGVFKEIIKLASKIDWPSLGPLPIIVAAPFLILAAGVMFIYNAIQKLASKFEWPSLGDLPKLPGADIFTSTIDKILTLYDKIGTLIGKVFTLPDIKIPDIFGGGGGNNNKSGGGGGDSGGFLGLPDPVSLISGFLTDIGNLVKNFTWPSWPDIPSPDFSKLATLISTGNTGISTVVDAITTPLGTTLQTGLTLLGAAAVAAFGDAIAVASTSGTSLVTGANDVIGTVIGAFGQLGTDMMAVGSNAVYALGAGLQDAAALDYVRGSAAAAAGAATAGASNALQIKSPSKVFMALGDFTAQGFGIGLTKAIPIVVQAAAGVGDAAVSATQDAVNSGNVRLDTGSPVSGIGGFITQIISMLTDAASSLSDDGVKRAKDVADAGKAVIDTLNAGLDLMTKLSSQSIQFGQFQVDNLLALRDLTATAMQALSDSAANFSDDGLKHAKDYSDTAKSVYDTLGAAFDFIVKMGDQVVQYGEWQAKNIANLKFFTEQAVVSIGDSAALMGDQFLNHAKTYADAGVAALNVLDKAFDFIVKMGERVINYGAWQARNIANLKFFTEQAVLSIGDAAALMSDGFLSHAKLFADTGVSALAVLDKAFDFIVKMGDQVVRYGEWQAANIASLKFFIEQATRSLGDSAAMFNDGYLKHTSDFADTAGKVVSLLSSTLDLLDKLIHGTKLTGERMAKVQGYVDYLSGLVRTVGDAFNKAADGFTANQGADALATAVGQAYTAMGNVLDLTDRLTDTTKHAYTDVTVWMDDITKLVASARIIATLFAGAAAGFEATNVVGVQPLADAVSAALDTLKNVLDLLDALVSKQKLISTSMEFVLGATILLSQDALEIAKVFAATALGFESVNTDGVTPLHDAVGSAVEALKNTLDLLQAMKDGSDALTINPDLVEANAKNLAQKARLIADAFNDATKGWDDQVGPKITAFGTAVGDSTGALSNVLDLLKAMSDGPIRLLYLSPAKIKRGVEQLRDIALMVAKAVGEVNWGDTVDPKLAAFSTDVQNSTSILQNVMDLISSFEDFMKPKDTSSDKTGSKPINVKDVIKKVLGDLDEILTAVQGEAKQWAGALGDVQTFAQTVQEVLAIIQSAISLSGVGKGTDLSGLKDVIGQIIDLFKTDLFQQLLTQIQDMLPQMREAGVGIGQSIGDGIVAGMQASEPAILAEAQHIADAIHEKIKKALEISSPSKVMIEVGENVGQGLIVGMSNMTQNVAKQAAALAQPVAQVATSATNGGGVSMTAGGLVPYDPSYVPTGSSSSGGGSSTTVTPPTGKGADQLAAVFKQIVGGGNWLTAAFGAAKMAGGFNMTDLDENIKDAYDMLHDSSKATDLQMRNTADQLGSDWKSAKAPYGATAEPGNSVAYLSERFGHWVGSKRSLEDTLALVQKAAGGYNNTHADEQLVWSASTLSGKNKPELLRYYNMADALERNMARLGIPALAVGGVANNATLAMIGEAGPEMVLPLAPHKLAMVGRGVADGMVSFIADSTKHATALPMSPVMSPAAMQGQSNTKNQGGEDIQMQAQTINVHVGGERLERIQNERTVRRIKSRY